MTAPGGESARAASPPENRPAPLQLRLLGPFAAHVRGCPLRPLRSRRGEWLLALLALRAGRAVERSWLAGTLWPDSSEEQALSSLRRTLTDLRAALGPEACRLESPTPRTLRLDLTGASVDVMRFDAGIHAGDLEFLRRAVQAYRGLFLEGCAEEWAFAERRARQEAYLRALERLAEAARRTGDHAEAVRLLRLATMADPLRESSHRQLMRALAGAGSHAEAVAVFHALRQRLQSELRASPDRETELLYRQIRAGAEPAARAARLIAWADGRRASVGGGSAGRDPARLGAALARLQERLGAERFAREWAAGRRMSVEEAVALALGDEE